MRCHRGNYRVQVTDRETIDHKTPLGHGAIVKQYRDLDEQNVWRIVLELLAAENPSEIVIIVVTGFSSDTQQPERGDSDAS